MRRPLLVALAMMQLWAISSWAEHADTSSAVMGGRAPAPLNEKDEQEAVDAERKQIEDLYALKDEVEKALAGINAGGGLSSGQVGEAAPAGSSSSPVPNAD